MRSSAKRRAIAVLASCALATVGGAPADANPGAAQPSRPNIVLMFSGNLGGGEVGANGGVRELLTQSAQGTLTYRVLATSKTSTMQKEMQEAGAAGFRFVAVMGGETAIGGKEVVVLMEKRGADTTKYEYRLLATSKTSTLQKELQEAADAGWQAVGQTVFESMFGGKETAGILERNPESPRGMRFEYKLIATTKTSTLQKELQEAAQAGYEAVGMTVGNTAVGGAELVVITRKLVR